MFLTLFGILLCLVLSARTNLFIFSVPQGSSGRILLSLLVVVSRGFLIITVQMAYHSISIAVPLNCKLCPKELLPYDRHDLCPSCLGVQHLKEALMNPCPHSSLLSKLDRQLRLAGLDHNQDASVLQADLTLRQRAQSAAPQQLLVLLRLRKNLVLVVVIWLGTCYQGKLLAFL